MDFLNYIQPELLVLVPALYALGSIIKNTEKINDKYIPLMLTVIGIVLSCIYVLGTEGITAISIFTAFVQGVLVAAAAVYSHQLIKQSKK